MSKAEDRALIAYPSTPNWDEKITRIYRGGFIKGYNQAEKDLALTWGDIDTIYNLLCEEFNYQLECGKRPQKEACQEVLKRFKRTKEL